jgi:hypothetical protein
MATSASSAGARRVSRRAQRGAAMLGLLAVVVMAFAYVVTSRLNAASERTAIDRAHNAKVLNQAKQALIGWVAMNAAGTDQNPGRVPCPEAPGFFGDPSQEGIAAGSCTLPAVGRLPWRTLGLDRLVDSAGEPLWYAVSPGWALPNSTATLTINSDTTGQLTLDGGEAVALVIAPGSALLVKAGTGCVDWTQSRLAAGPPNLRNYLECENATSPADVGFVASRPGQTFNDQVLRVSSADVIPALEAAIAERMQREIAPALSAAGSTMYTSAQYPGLLTGGPFYPSPVPFENPATSSYVGVSSSLIERPQGLLPFNRIDSTCTSPHPCTQLPLTGTVRVTGGSGYGGSLDSYSCSASTTDLLCTGVYREDSSDPWKDVRIEMTATFRDVANGFRVLSPDPLSLTLAEARDNGSTSAWLTPATSLVTSTPNMNDGSTTHPDGSTPPRGSVTFRVRATLPNIDANGWGSYADFRIRVQRSVFTDHFLLNPDPNVATNPLGAATSWFVRNEWYRNTYYAVPTGHTAAILGAPGVTDFGCSTSTSSFDSLIHCLQFNDASISNVRALLVLAGRRLDTQTRHNNNRQNYFEGEYGSSDYYYEQRVARKSKTTLAPPTDPYYAPWNDRVVPVDWAAASTSLQRDPITLRIVSLP